MRVLLFIFIMLGFCACHLPKDDAEKLFTLLDSTQTGIGFENIVTDTKDFNIYTYRNFYNGGGVAIGDINNDGLADIYFTSNMGSNKLYLNKGKVNGSFRFEDITQKAGVEGTKLWSTGVTMADVNADGFLDIYVCNSGGKKDTERQNELFINNKNGTFTEKAEEYGLADKGLTTHASFFDYDRDGDLDAYILNNSFRAIGSFNLALNDRNIRNELGGDKLYRNDNGKFKDVSQQANIYGSEIGFGLGVVASDFNNDGWVDIYVCNDFFERDYLYINQKNGTFSEELTKQMPSISQASMGADAADINADGLPELFVTEMLPQQEERLKTAMTFENWDKFRYNEKFGYHHQFTRNMLHLNNGANAQSAGSFSEIGRYSGVEATDWSWGALMVDLDNNGFKDIFVTNGIYKDILNQDYLKFIASDEFAKSVITSEGVNYKKLIDIIPSKPISNYAYSGNTDLKFSDVTTQWGFEQPSFSNGSAYGDLDNDGDLDLVINNVNMPAFIYRNETSEKYKNSFLKIKLKGKNKNTFAIGTKVLAYAQEKIFMLEQIPARSFQSSVNYEMVFGLDKIQKIDSLIIRWPQGGFTKKYNLKCNQALVFDENKESITLDYNITGSGKSTIWKAFSSESTQQFIHQENEYSDFNVESLLFHMNSTEGTKMAVGDVNGDGLDDAFIGAGKDFAAKLLQQTADGKFISTNQKNWEMDKNAEDTDAVFFDADKDGDLDLYVACGGSEFAEGSIELSNRLYFNDGKGNFSKSFQFLPTLKPENTSCVRPADFDNDGDIDLFVGIRAANRHYGLPQSSYILVNNGKGIFSNLSHNIAKDLTSIGMVRDAQWVDFNLDKQLDLIIVGEWMNPVMLKNNRGVFENVSKKLGLTNLKGWWNTVNMADIDQDGDPDFVLGNHGLNSRFRASVNKPLSCFAGDFDNNSVFEQIICTYNGDKSYPLALHQNMTTQLPYLKSKYLKNESYKNQQITDIFTREQLGKAHYLDANILESIVLINNQAKGFSVQKLPFQAQLFPVYAIHFTDLNHDKFPDLILGGNLFEVKPEVGAYDAGRGLCLIGKGNGIFDALLPSQSGVYCEGQIRDIKSININGKLLLAFVKNNASFQFFERNK